MNAFVAGRATGKLALVLVLTSVWVLAACGSAGGGTGTGTADAGARSKLFVADALNALVVSAADANPAPGVLILNRTISGPSASNVMPKMAYDAAADRLYIVNDRSIAVLDNASTRNGLTNPDRTISSAALQLTITAIFLDTVNDLLYVADQALDFLVFNNASVANGSVVPARTLSITRQSAPVPVNDVYVDTTRDILYISGHVGAGGVNSVILAYDSARSLATGPIVANRELTFAASLDDIVGDGANDRLFISDTGAGTVMVFDNASGMASGIGIPTRTINLPGFAQRLALAPVSDRLYAIASNAAGVQIINAASSAAGTVPITLVTSATAARFSALAVAP